MKRGHSLFIGDILEVIKKTEKFVANMNFDKFVRDDKIAIMVIKLTFERYLYLL